MIGDSITAGYKWHATKELADRATVDAYCNPYNQANNSWHTEMRGIFTNNGPYSVMLPHLNLSNGDNVHWKSEAGELLGRAVAKAVVGRLAATPQKAPPAGGK